MGSFDLLSHDSNDENNHKWLKLEEAMVILK